MALPAIKLKAGISANAEPKAYNDKINQLFVSVAPVTRMYRDRDV
jgi:hypothetical protein